MRVLTSVFSGLILSGFAAAQCAFSSVAASTYGSACLVFGNPTSIAASLDVPSCSLGLDVSAFPGCCNTYLVGTVLVVGLQPVAQPLPSLGCTLLAQPDLVLFSTTGGSFALPMPPAPFPPTTIHAQAVSVYFTTIGFSTDWAFSTGYQLDLQ